MTTGYWKIVTSAGKMIVTISTLEAVSIINSNPGCFAQFIRMVKP